MLPHHSSRSGFLADYFPFKTAGILRTVRPAKLWRRLRGLRRLPFVTGSSLAFIITIDAKNADKNETGVLFLHRFRPGTGIDAWIDVAQGKEQSIWVRQREWGQYTGQHHLEGDVAIEPDRGKDHPINWNIVRADMLSSDTVAVTVAVVLLSVIIAVLVGLMSIGGLG